MIFYFVGRQKKKRSVKKTKDSAEVPAVDDGDNVAPTIVEGPSKPETPKAMKSASAPATDAAGGGVGDDGQREVTTSPQDAVSSGSVGADKKNEEGKHSDVPPEDADKRRAKEGSPSAAALLAQEILSPVMATLPPESDEPYVPPTAVEAGDMNALQELDERKIIELREAFNLFDLDHDGCIDAADLKATFATLGVEVPDEFIAGMLADAMDPLDFQSFVLMYGIRTIEMDPEAVLLEALSKWDKERTGQISIERLVDDAVGGVVSGQINDNFAVLSAE